MQETTNKLNKMKTLSLFIILLALSGCACVQYPKGLEEWYKSDSVAQIERERVYDSCLMRPTDYRTEKPKTFIVK